uniref:Scavenger receptor class F member 1 n=1 Tax=Oncorhynchus mykiss TaxID=8022 RepID=A0A8C7UK66_ONCMY
MKHSHYLHNCNLPLFHEKNSIKSHQETSYYALQYVFCLPFSNRNPSTLVCCTGWRHQREECTLPVCDGEQACQQDEVCVYPGVCRCRPGYYGAHCKTRCPPEFWAPDCRELCKCHPHGRCDPITGKCTCLSNRWGPLCQNTCKCGRHGHCHPVHGNCTCDEGWWTPTCAKQCQCYPGTSTCDPLTGRCQCAPGYWGQKCSLRCSCYTSSCQQKTGACECQNGWWGPTCDRHCNCDLEHSECNAVSGECVCQPGYKGAFCNEPCGPGEYGSGCTLSCGHCEGGQSCSVVDGVCTACEPGWNGTHCDRLCPHGYHGNYCQEACPRCRNGEPCDPRTGACSRCGHRALITGFLVPLLLVLLGLVCCCCCCGGPTDGKDRCVCVYNSDDKDRCVCVPLTSDLALVLQVSHHDPELTFNHSFIEPPSSGWVTEGSFFDSDEETGEVLYCVPPREGNQCVISAEDMSLPFGIPRTSSNAKSKCPSVSFAEGTRSYGEAGDPDVDRWTATPTRAMSTLQVPGAVVGRTISNAAVPRKGGQTPGSTSDGQQAEMDKVTTVYVTVGKLPSLEGPVQAMLRRLGSLQRHKDQEVGTKPKGKSPGTEGITKPPRRKLGTRSSVWEQGAPPPSGVEGAVGEGVSMRKPSRRKQHAHHSSPAVMGNTDTNTQPLPEDSPATVTPTRPLSSILKSVPEVAGSKVRGERSGVRRENGDPGMQTDSGYRTIGPAGFVTDTVSLSEVITNEGVVAGVDDGPNLYENVMIMHS